MLSNFKKNYSSRKIIDIHRDHNSDNVYVNIQVNNTDPNAFITASATVDRTEPIIDDPDKYYLSVVRFTIPGLNTPILIFPIQNNQPNINLSTYSITLDHAVSVSQQFLIYTQRNVFIPPTTAIPVQKISSYYFIFNYQHVADMINTAFEAAFAVITKPPTIGLDPPRPPRIIFNSVTQLFSIIAQDDYYNIDTAVSLIRIYINGPLFTLLPGLADQNTLLSSPGFGRNLQILVKDYFNNRIQDSEGSGPSFPPPYLEIRQQFKSLANWYSVKNIVFKSGLLPLQPEYTQSSNNFQPIFTDFEPLAQSGSDVRSRLQYFPQGPYRLVSLVGHNPIQTFDIRVSWTDIYGNEFPISIPYLQAMTIKLLFVHRDLYKNEKPEFIDLAFFQKENPRFFDR